MADTEEDGEPEKRFFKLNVHTPSFYAGDLIIRFISLSLLFLELDFLFVGIMFVEMK